jgi:hypothetical protein
MNPQFDLVMPLLNVPFSRRSEIEKRQILASVADALQEHANVNKILYNENVRKNRLLATYLIDVTLLLGKQELAFRGHDETEISVNQGNLREIFQCLIKPNVELAEHASKLSNIFTGQSKTIQNELIFCVSQYLKEFIYNEIFFLLLPMIPLI